MCGGVRNVRRHVTSVIVSLIYGSAVFLTEGNSADNFITSLPLTSVLWESCSISLQQDNYRQLRVPVS